METTAATQTPKNYCAARVIRGLFLFIIGLIIGAFGARYVWHGATTVASRNSTAGSGALAIQPAGNPAAPAQFASWDPLRQIAQLQAQIDQDFQRSFAQFHANAHPASLAATPGYSLSMDVRDLKDKYQVRAYLPDTKASDVNVKLNGDELKVDVANKITEKPTAKNGETAMTEWGNYEEVVPLSGPLKSDNMKIERLPHELIISVPKA